MFHLLGQIIKWGLLTLVILIMGQAIEWKGQTLSDRVKTGMAAAKRSDSYMNLKSWSNQQLETLEQKIGPSNRDHLNSKDRKEMKNLLKDLD